MARTIAQIQSEMITAMQGEPSLAGLTSTSSVAVWRWLLYIVASSIWILEKLYDLLRTEINDIISRMKPHTLRWYAEKAKAFQYGDALPPDTDKYDNTGLTEDQIASSKIIKYAACTRQLRTNGRVFLRMKLAKEVAGDLAALTIGEKAAAVDYLFRVSDAGVDMQVDSLPPDQIKQEWVIYYDPLILDGNGSRLDGQDSEPVRKAIKAYLLELLFNGTYVPTYHIDAVQKVEGVVIPVLTLCQAKYGAFPFGSVGSTYIPDAGYLRFENETDLVINYVPQTEIR